MLSFPVFWALGLPWLWGPVVTFPMLVYLLRRLSSLRTPKGFGIWILFLGWTLVSATQLLQYGADRWFAFFYRSNFYYSATIAFLFFFNVERDRIPYRSVVRAIAAFWVVVIALGVVALVAPKHQRFTSPAAKLLPSAVLADRTIYQQAYPQFAQDVNIIGWAVPRPSAPFAASNVWGSNVALTTPFALLAFQMTKRRRTRLLLAAAFAVGLVPFVMSLNRGAWGALSAGVLYAAVRAVVRRGGWSKILKVAVPLLIVIAAIFVSPLGGIIGARLAHPHSNAGRLAGDEEASRRVMDSPILGYGTPLPSEDDPTMRHSVGTHGQIWLVLFSQGFPGLILYLAFFGFVFLHTRRARDPQELWTHVLVLIAVMMMPVYGILGSGLMVLMSVIAVTFRDDRQPRPQPLLEPEASPWQ